MSASRASRAEEEDAPAGAEEISSAGFSGRGRSGFARSVTGPGLDSACARWKECKSVIQSRTHRVQLNRINARQAQQQLSEGTGLSARLSETVRGPLPVRIHEQPHEPIGERVARAEPPRSRCRCRSCVPSGGQLPWFQFVRLRRAAVAPVGGRG